MSCLPSIQFQNRFELLWHAGSFTVFIFWPFHVWLWEDRRAAAHLFLPVATPVAVMPQLALRPTPPLVDAIQLTPVGDVRSKDPRIHAEKQWPPSTAAA